MNNTAPPLEAKSQLWRNTLLWRYLILRELKRMGLKVDYKTGSVLVGDPEYTKTKPPETENT